MQRSRKEHPILTEENSPKRYILANDPSMTAWGWVVLTSTGQVIEAGAIKTEPHTKKLKVRKGDDRIRRVVELNTELLEIIRKYNIALILSELPHGSQSASAAVMIGIVAGVAQTISNCLEIPIEWFSEGDAKKALVGRSNASKTEIKMQIHSRYKVPWTNTKWIDEAVADAMAIFHVAKQQSNLLKMLR